MLLTKPCTVTVAAPAKRPSALIDVDTKQRYELVRREVVSVGKHRDNDIRLANDPAACDCHALIMFAVNNFWLEDLGSSCGTFVNDVRLEKPVMLAAGDTLLIGRTRFAVV